MWLLAWLGGGKKKRAKGAPAASFVIAKEAGKARIPPGSLVSGPGRLSRWGHTLDSDGLRRYSAPNGRPSTERGSDARDRGCYHADNGEPELHA